MQLCEVDGYAAAHAEIRSHGGHMTEIFDQISMLDGDQLVDLLRITHNAGRELWNKSILLDPRGARTEIRSCADYEHGTEVLADSVIKVLECDLVADVYLRLIAQRIRRRWIALQDRFGARQKRSGGLTT